MIDGSRCLPTHWVSCLSESSLASRQAQDGFRGFRLLDYKIETIQGRKHTEGEKCRSLAITKRMIAYQTKAVGCSQSC